MIFRRACTRGIFVHNRLARAAKENGPFLELNAKNIISGLLYF